MGAPLLNWILRGVVTAALLGGIAAIAWAPVGLAGRLALFVVGAAAATCLAFRFLPAFDPLGRVRWRLPRAEDGVPRCALTFDDGPSASTETVREILREHNVPATFFVLGEHVRRHPDVVRRLQADGHAIGFHGTSHRKLGGASSADVEQELSGLAALFEELCIRPAAVYRTPHGHKSSAIFEAARGRGLTIWAWSRGVWDTDRPAADVLVRRATRRARSGMVLLLHDGRGDDPEPDVSAMVAALPLLICRLKAMGFRFVRLTGNGPECYSA